MDLRERLTVHLPCEQNLFTLPNFAPRDGDSIVINILFPGGKRGGRMSDYSVEIGRDILKVSVSSNQLQMLAFGEHTTTCNFKDLLK